MENVFKQRNGCISFWLWIAIITNIALVIFNAVKMFGAFNGVVALGLGLCSILGAVNVLSAILLLRWNKIGFYMVVVSSIMAIVVNIFVLKMELMATIGSLFAIVIWWAILQIEKGGVSAWSQLQSGWDGKHCNRLYQIFATIGAVLVILTLIAFSNASNNNNDSEYEDVAVVEVADEETMTKDEVAKGVFFDSFADGKKDTIVYKGIEGEMSPEQQNRKNESSINKKTEFDSNPTLSPTSNNSEDYTNYESFLKKVIKETNKSFPVKATEGIIIKRCYLDGDFVMYHVECDENLYDIELLNMGKSNMKQSIKDMIRQNSDPLVSHLVQYCVMAHKGLGFKYQGDFTGNSCIVKVSYLELTNL